MHLIVETDPDSGFCGGVIRAIGKAESFLGEVPSGERLYSLGAIVHNEAELDRLQSKGLEIITKDDLGRLPSGSTVFIRAHGEPPETYTRIRETGLSVIDCTCPVVLKLQSRIRDAYARVSAASPAGQVLIFGKVGHAEILGLVGQIGGNAVVFENRSMLESYISEGKICLDGPIEVFSQTTKSPSEYTAVCDVIREAVALRRGISQDIITEDMLSIHDTICSQVGSRHRRLSEFAAAHDVIIFVAGKESSNGRVLSELCRKVNPRTWNVGDGSEISPDWFKDGDRVGVCGATSTPKWLLEDIGKKILHI